MHDFPIIVLIFLIVSYPKETVIFSISPIGKFVAICLILFYTSINELYGLITCAICILYYQSDYVENIEHFFATPINKSIKPSNELEYNTKNISGQNIASGIGEMFASFISGDPSTFTYTPVYAGSYNEIIENVKNGKKELMQLFNNARETSIDLIYGNLTNW